MNILRKKQKNVAKPIEPKVPIEESLCKKMIKECKNDDRFLELYTWLVEFEKEREAWETNKKQQQKIMTYCWAKNHLSEDKFKTVWKDEVLVEAPTDVEPNLFWEEKFKEEQQKFYRMDRERTEKRANMVATFYEQFKIIKK